MIKLTKPLAIVLLGTLTTFAACSKRESPAEVNSDVAKAEATKTENVSEALKDQAQVNANTAADIVAADPDKRGEAIEDRAEEAYKVAAAKAEGDMKIAKQACDALPAASQAACNQKAQGVYDIAKAQAKATRENVKAQGDAVKKLDNK